VLVEKVLELLRLEFGEDWARDEEANLRFTVDAEQVLRHIDGLHLIGEPELEDGRITITFWVDEPIPDLMRADQLAYDVFGRISEDFFYTERRVETKGIRYPFVTGSSRHGHVGSVLLAGPNATAFAERHHLRTTGGTGFQA
jgi:hypothetical protein